MRYDAIRRLRPRAQFELVQDGTNDGRPYLATYTDPDGQPAPTVAEAAAAAALIDSEAEAAATAAAQLRAQVRTVAQSAVGVRFDLLTAAQVRALVAILLWKQGALGSDGAVRPLDDWAR